MHTRKKPFKQQGVLTRTPVTAVRRTMNKTGSAESHSRGGVPKRPTRTSNEHQNCGFRAKSALVNQVRMGGYLLLPRPSVHGEFAPRVLGLFDWPNVYNTDERCETLLISRMHSFQHTVKIHTGITHKHSLKLQNFSEISNATSLSLTISSIHFWTSQSTYNQPNHLTDTHTKESN